MGCGSCRNEGGPIHRVHISEAALKTPRYHPGDGSITFPEGTPMVDIDGYGVDEDDHRRLVSHMPECQYRITGIMLQKDSTFKPHHVCTGPCEHRTKPVTYAICSGCPLSHKEADPE